MSMVLFLICCGSAGYAAGLASHNPAVGFFTGLALFTGVISIKLDEAIEEIKKK